jgi:hypothetical protein
MKDFEKELDIIRIKLLEETYGLDKEEIISKVNSHAQKIAKEFGIIIKNSVYEKQLQTVNL